MALLFSQVEQQEEGHHGRLPSLPCSLAVELTGMNFHIIINLKIFHFY